MFANVKKYAATLLITMVGSAAATAQQGPQQMPPAQVEVVTAEVRMLAPQMDVSATIISVNDSRISTEVEGSLTWIAETGTVIAKGDVIARIDNRLLKINHRRAAANLARLQADMTFRDLEVGRFQELAKRDNTSKSRLQEVIARRAMLEQDIVEADAQLERTVGDLARTEIRAPFSGHIVARLANIGEYLNIGSEVARLVDTNNVEVALAAPLSIAPFLKQDDVVTVFDARVKKSLPIRTIVPVGDSVSRMMEVRLSLTPGTWVIGAPVKVTLAKGIAVQTVAVPRDALVLKGSRAYVFRIGADMKAQQVPADVRGTVGLWVVANSQIKEGDKIVVRGGERLQPGQDVIINNK